MSCGIETEFFPETDQKCPRLTEAIQERDVYFIAHTCDNIVGFNIVQFTIKNIE